MSAIDDGTPATYWGSFESATALAQLGVQPTKLCLGDTATVDGAVYICTSEPGPAPEPGQERSAEALRRLGRRRSVWLPLRGA